MRQLLNSPLCIQRDEADVEYILDVASWCDENDGASIPSVNGVDLAHIVAADDCDILIVMEPPGCGKTTAVVECVEVLNQNSNVRRHVPTHVLASLRLPMVRRW
jgi:hypothetical protein